VAIVGEGMAFRPGTGATFTKAMANAGVNIRSIAQGASERQISICVEQDDCTRALRAAHQALALSNTQLSLTVIGATGQVGKEFLSQLAESQRVIDSGDVAGKRKVMDDLRLDFKVTGLARSGRMRLGYDGIPLTDVSSRLTEGAEGVVPFDLDALTSHVIDDYNGNRVVVDCTASQQVADHYPEWLSRGIHVISANKRGGSGDLKLYDDCMRYMRSRAQWRYETTGPGSGLPVLSSLKDMSQSGDRVYEVKGVFSATNSYMLNEIRAGTKFSEAVQAAVAQGLTEPDPREDLDGVDVRRKVVVLARQLGLRLNMDDVECESLMPPRLKFWKPDTSKDAPSIATQLVDALRPYDDEQAKRFGPGLAKGQVPVQVSTVSVEKLSAQIRVEQVDENERFARCLSNENIVEIQSRRYSASPMIMQGQGAGPTITAYGLFSDLLHLSRSLVEWNIPDVADVD
jgi:aspartokinase/homoserine dehydrogenase 1